MTTGLPRSLPIIAALIATAATAANGAQADDASAVVRNFLSQPAATLAVGAITIVNVILTAWLGRRAMARQADIGKELQGLSNKFKVSEKKDERAHLLRMQRLEPFAADLFKSIALAVALKLSVHKLKDDDMPAVIRKLRIQSSDVPQRLGEVAVQLSAQKASLLLAVQSNLVSGLVQAVNQLHDEQVQLLDLVAKDFAFSPDDMAAFDKRFETLATHTTEVFKQLRRAVDDEPPAWNDEGLKQTLFYQVTALANIVPTWRVWAVWWSLGDVEPDGFGDARLAFLQALRSVLGVLEVRDGEQADANVKGGRIVWVSVHFLNKAYLDGFAEVLGDIKRQCKPLWGEAASPREIWKSE